VSLRLLAPSFLAFACAALELAGCSHKQTAPTPAPVGTSMGSIPASLASRVLSPWTNASPNPSPQTVANMTAPLDVAMVMCSSALNLAPCGIIATGANDTMTCLSGCQSQIETVVAMTVQRAAEQCASGPLPEAGARECDLAFPATAALDTAVVGRTCNVLCEQMAGGPGR